MLQYIHWDVDPIIFKLGFIELRWYSLLFATTFLVGIKLIAKFFKESNLNPKLVDHFFVYTILAVIIGARLGHCLFYEPEYYFNHIAEMLFPFDFSNGIKFTGYRGLSSHGGAVGMLISTGLYCRKYKINYFWMMDKLVIVTALGGLFIRTGNLINSEIIGSPSTLPWAFIFEKIDNIPRHPAQLYEAISYFLIFILLFLCYQKYRTKIFNGVIFGVFLILTFSARFFIEFIKKNQVAFEQDMSYNMGQLLSLPLILSGILIIIYSYKKNKNKNIKK